MSAGIYDIYIEQGATFQKIITWKDSSGTAINLTGYIARMQFRSQPTSDTVLFEATTENGRIALGGAAGTVTITITATLTAGFDFGCAVYDLELQSSSQSGAVVTRLLEGSVNVSKEVTR
jgi:hypothetical protein